MKLRILKVDRPPNQIVIRVSSWGVEPDYEAIIKVATPDGTDLLVQTAKFRETVPKGLFLATAELKHRLKVGNYFASVQVGYAERYLDFHATPHFIAPVQAAV